MPPRIGIFLVDKGTHAELAVSDDTGRHALRNGRHLAADYEDAVVTARHIRLDNNVAAACFPEGDVERATDVVFTPDIERNSATVVAVQWLDHDRIANLVRGGSGGLGRAHYL
jgi:hypothetical protein